MKLKRCLKTLTVLPMALLSQTAHAGAYTTAAIISEIAPRENGLDILVASAGNPMACAWTGMFRLPTSAANYQVIASVLMTAAAQRRPVQVYANSCDGDGASLILAARVATI